MLQRENEVKQRCLILRNELSNAAADANNMYKSNIKIPIFNLKTKFRHF